MNSIEIHVKGQPFGQPRTRAAVVAGQVRMFTSPPSKSARAAFKAWGEALDAAILPRVPATPIDKPVILTCVFHMPRPKHHFGTGRNAGKLKRSAPYWHTSKPDLDNLIKMVKDHLTTMRLWTDDNRACRYGGDTMKHYAMGDPGAMIRIEVMEVRDAQ